jgi:hypothetical protein
LPANVKSFVGHLANATFGAALLEHNEAPERGIHLQGAESFTSALEY